MKKIRQIFKSKKTSTITPPKKDVTHAIISLVLMVISIDAHHQSAILKIQKETSKCKTDASKPTALIHLPPMIGELNSNDSIKT